MPHRPPTRDHLHEHLVRIECLMTCANYKLDLLLARANGMDTTTIEALTEKLKSHTDALEAAVATQPHSGESRAESHD